MKDQEKYGRYWKRNIRLVVALLAIWMIPSFFLSIIFVEKLNEIQIAGFPLGFWFAQQGSIYIFVVLVLVYAVLMDRLDREFRDDSEDRQ